MYVRKRPLSASEQNEIKSSNFSNKRLHAFMRVMCTVLGTDLKDIVTAPYLKALHNCDAIYSAKAKFDVVVEAKKWIAPLYKPHSAKIKIKKSTFVLVREGDMAVDLEIGTEVYTLTAQEWREKRGYFLIPNLTRFKGSLAENVRRITQIKRKQETNE